MAKRAAATSDRARVRCAIYTRKSTKEGLDQEFNSLDAQREACAAYILSQRHEGWVEVKTAYDDGGFSGGNMERPGLRTLLADVDAGKVDVIVVYKVDRLTRALADFAKIVEVLDTRGASFVSVTQAFNTTTSMGRLTLNVLLSFAQFEREVTGERIRDKIAASKKKGMWMGGNPPLGYDVVQRRLVANEIEAETVRHIFRRYVALGSGQALVEELRQTGHRSKLHRGRGGVPFQRGTLYHLLANPIYIGRIVHHGVAHDGEHAGIVPLELWDAAQALLAANRAAPARNATSTERSLLAGRIVDGEGRRMTPSHTAKGSRRYRYYVTHARDLSSEGPPARRIAAHHLDALVVDRIVQLLANRGSFATFVACDDADALAEAFRLAPLLARRLRHSDQRRPIVEALVHQVRLASDHVAVEIRPAALRNLLGRPVEEPSDEIVTLIARATRARQAKDVCLIVASEDGCSTGAINAPLVALLAEARAAYDLVLASPTRTVAEIAKGSGRCRKRLAKLLRIALLAPDIVERCLDGTQPATLTTARLFAADLPLGWNDQRQLLGLG